MTWQITDQRAGYPGILQVTTNQFLVPPGTIVRAADETFGEGEFIYLGVPASTTLAVGNIVKVVPTTIAATTANAAGVRNLTLTEQPFADLVAAADGGTGQMVAVSLSAITTSASEQKFAWFQITGRVPVIRTGTGALTAGTIFIGTSAGKVSITGSGFEQLIPARRIATASAASPTVTVNLNRTAIQAGTG